MTEDSEREARLAEIAEQHARKARLEERYGVPENIAASDALRLLGITYVTDAADFIGHIYRDQEAADGWLASNLEHHGHPALGTAPLPDGRVVGILDLRPSMARAREEARRAHDSGRAS